MPSEDALDSTVEAVLAHAAAHPPTLGDGRLVGIDGPAGAGKTTLAAAVAESSGATVVHLDDLYAGWTGLPDVEERLEELLRPLAAGEPGFYRRYDWQVGRYAELHLVPPTELLVLEGVGAGARAIAELVTTLVWVDAPQDLRRSRGLERDGETFAPHWQAWAEAEAARFAVDAAQTRADLHVGGHGGLLRRP